MKKLLSLLLCAVMIAPAFAGTTDYKALYRGGSVPDLKTNQEAKLVLSRPDVLVFGKLQVPYDKIQSVEYGQKAGRRVGAAIATAILVSPVGLFLLFSKKRNHIVSLTWTNAEGKSDGAVFEINKDAIRSTLKILEVKTGKEIIYESPEARANIGK
jgi:hypothetical protein